MKRQIYRLRKIPYVGCVHYRLEYSYFGLLWEYLREVKTEREGRDLYMRAIEGEFDPAFNSEVIL